MPCELVTDGRPDSSGTAPVDHAQLVPSGKGSGVDEHAERLAGLLRRPPAHVELRLGMGRCRRADRDRRLGWDLGSPVAIRSEPVERNSHAETTVPEHGSLVPRHLDDRPADTE